MNDKDVSYAVAILADAWQMGTVLQALPDYCRPQTPAEGMAIQDALVANLGLPVAGWKIGCTSAAAQKILKATEPFAGRIFETRVFPSGIKLPPSAYPMRGLEGEFAFVLARNLKPRRRPYTPAEVKAAVDSVHPAIEIVSSRFADMLKVNTASLIADMGANSALVIGPAIPRWRSLDLARVGVRMSVNGKKVGGGTGADVLGSPLNALAWLANHLGSRGGLKAGDIVSTGTCTGLYLAKPGDRVTASFGRHGKVAFTFIK